MSTRGRGRGTRGRGRGGGARAGSSASGHMPAREAPASPVTETGSHDWAGGYDAVSQAVIRVLEKGCWSKGISGVAPNVAEYWLEAIERIIDDLDCTVEWKLKGAMSLL
ncbi:Fructose-1,6-bisphosphatase class 1 [Gossypium australe]|uniref:Fructose-1,6-bisphosphatase class 1 n=1 Tax=Gossypium australe TaxID=47621 RepID=A0A5B6VA37_9ROSI|nr:Fructose-1,6-bisphosphatase class 1 [Gossypium australe]